jgi:phosphoribosylaminoimidazolecarboxamide formyltransferase/IMP cyclohydrolase
MCPLNAGMLRYVGVAGNRGRNLLHLQETVDDVATLAAIVATDPAAPIVDAATARDVAVAVVDPTDFEDSDAFDGALARAVIEYTPDVVCFDGMMEIVGTRYLEEAPPTINVHPSLLPAFPGLDVHARVLEAGVEYTGCTVHLVTEGVDTGPIITQEAVRVRPEDTVERLRDRVRTDAEFTAYPRAIRSIASGAIEFPGDDTLDRMTDHPQVDIRRGRREQVLRYGENPHQSAVLYRDQRAETGGLIGRQQLNPQARALSYNNYLDADAALQLIRRFEAPAAVVIKHMNPAGCALAADPVTAYRQALATDPMSAFGGVVGINRALDAETAAAITESFKEVVIAPSVTDAAQAAIAAAGSVRVLTYDASAPTPTHVTTPITGGYLRQDPDTYRLTPADLEVVTDAPVDIDAAALGFGWEVTKRVSSNAIVLTKGTATVGIGMGQVSRVDAVELAIRKAREHADSGDPAGAVLFSDAFFPFPDAIDLAADAEIAAIIQPGGSTNDAAVIERCDEHGIGMGFTGHRGFRHT